MFLKLIFIFLLCKTLKSSSQDFNLTYNGFRAATNLRLDGIAFVTSSGILQLTNFSRMRTGHAFYAEPVRFKASQTGNVSSFSTTFVFAIVSEIPTLSGHGIAFVVAPTARLPFAQPSQYLGLFSQENNGNATNHVFAVELDTIQSREFGDINDNHAGIDINSLRSDKAEPAGFWDDASGRFTNLSLISRKPMQVWIDYEGRTTQINVTMAPFKADKPKKPLMSLVKDLSPILFETMYVGFTSATGSVLSDHYVLGWSFRVGGEAPRLALSKLPKLPNLPRTQPKRVPEFYKIGLPWIFFTSMLLSTSVLIYIIRRRRKFAEELEDWELEFGINRFKFKELYYATKRFNEKELLGAGGFGRVYKGIMPTRKLEIAVKRVSQGSRQGIKEFVAEIASIGRMSHRNIVPLLGYCRRKDELLLVYEYMPNGSLDKFLHNKPEVTLQWKQRFKIIKDVASGLFYLHEEWEHVTIHRDVKASNVLLDANLNGRLGDFGLARFYDHGSDPRTTNIAGTFGYLAPEYIRGKKATTAIDVFAFGMFLLEVACGRRPIENCDLIDEIFLLVEWVSRFWYQKNILDAKDPNLGSDYDPEEVELTLKLGLFCAHPDPRARPSMRQVLSYLQRDTKLPDLSLLDASGNELMFDGFSGASSVTASLLSGGR